MTKQNKMEETNQQTITNKTVTIKYEEADTKDIEPKFNNKVGFCQILLLFIKKIIF